MIINFTKKVRILTGMILTLLIVIGGGVYVYQSKNSVQTSNIEEGKNLNKYIMDVIFDDESKRLMCNQNVEYVNNTNIALDKIYFHIYPNAFSKKEFAPFEKDEMNQAYPNGFNEGYIDIKNVLNNNNKFERCGIRVCDLIDKEVFKEKLKDNIEMKNKYIVNVLGGEPLSFEEIYEEYSKYGEKLKHFVKDTSVRVYNEIKEDKTVLFEGAQGMLLDIDYGTYPYVTSSNTTAGGVANGVGIGPNMITNAVGIAKAYTTRVGKGPFPTELEDETGEWIREKGHEYGVTTGRSRRCGWLDIVILKTSVRVSGLTSLAVTKIDTLAGLEKVKMCVGYKFNDEIIDYFPASLEDLAKCEPIYEEFDGWDESVANARSYEELHPNARKYLERIEELTDTRISIVSVGPRRDQTMRVKPL